VSLSEPRIIRAIRIASTPFSSFSSIGPNEGLARPSEGRVGTPNHRFLPVKTGFLAICHGPGLLTVATSALPKSESSAGVHGRFPQIHTRPAPGSGCCEFPNRARLGLTERNTRAPRTIIGVPDAWLYGRLARQSLNSWLATSWVKPRNLSRLSFASSSRCPKVSSSCVRASIEPA